MSVPNYEEMLKKARKELPESVIFAERFEIPKAKGHLEGNKTIVSNFGHIAKDLRRPVNHMFKYILKELATPGVMRDLNTAVFGTKVSATRINEKIEQYTRTFVICSECGKPDTQIAKEGNVTNLKCSGCGAKKPIKSKI